MFVQYRTSTTVTDFPKSNHYWTEKFWFVLRDARYNNFLGSLALINVNLGKDSFRASADYTHPADIFNYANGAKRFFP